jgi:hypothetical protein
LVSSVVARFVDSVRVVDFWDSDLCAIGFQISDSPCALLYVSCYNTPPNKFDVIVEREMAPGVAETLAIGLLDSAEVFERLSAEIANLPKSSFG